MATTDAGQHGRDMAVADLERLTELSVAPGDAGEAPLESGDRKLHAAAFDLRSEVEADRLRVGRRLGKPLAAQPRGEVSPVSRVGALRVIGLGRAGVGLGGLRQRRQAAAEAPGGREQGRGVRAGSLGLRRHAFRLQAVRAVPDASMRTALRAGWRAGVGRGGAAVGADQRKQGEGIWRGGLAPPGGRAAASVQARSPRRFAFRRARDSLRLVRDGFQSIGCAARTDSAKAGQPVVQAASRQGRGRGGRPGHGGPRRVARRRLGAVPGISGRAPLPVRWPGGLGCGRPQARAKRRERAGGGRVRTGASRGVFRRLGRLRRVSSSAFGSRPGALGSNFPAFRIASERLSNSCPIMESYRTFSTHDKRGGFLATHRDKAPRKTHHTQVIRADLELLAEPPARRSGAPSRAAREARGEPRRAKRKPRNDQPLPPPAPIPAWARASGRAGESGPLFAAGAGARASGRLSARRAARRRGATRPPGAAERRGFRQNPAPQRRRSRAA